MIVNILNGKTKRIKTNAIDAIVMCQVTQVTTNVYSVIQTARSAGECHLLTDQKPITVM